MATVSILIANYNNGRYIAQALDSALAQTCDDIEIVVADDGSTDRSTAIITNYIAAHPEANISLHRNNAPKGCGRIKRQLVELSHGEYFIFLDPEDTFTPDAVATLLAGHRQGIEYSIVYSTHYLCNEQLQPYAVSDYPGAIAAGQSHLTSTAGHISAPALCRRSCYNRTEGINPAFYVAEDQDLYLKMEEVAPVLYVDKPLYYYRHHDHNTSWNDSHRAINLKYRHKVRAAAYRRRASTQAPNLSRSQYRRECFSYHLMSHNIYRKQHKPLTALGHLLSALPYLPCPKNHQF